MLDRLLDPIGRILTPEVARRLVNVRFDSRTQAHIDKLARKCNEGKLTDAERREYETCVYTIDFIAILQAKARALLSALRKPHERVLAPVRPCAHGRCEYCHLPDGAVSAARFHVEHVIAKQHGGSDGPDNRCWSCHRCNLHKGPNLSGRDPLTGHVVRLFNPRRQLWNRHFE